ncbi:MAG: UDP-N-acetylglucosamine 1-carboxyvinyltransferase [Oscillospiraceae bacterium]|jgi:UDP-N-acetylglucosamine 1-carboxyvinyltransferase|nr:UDP-N-acetylglucosamine 1-carboxyvinyltransferase [Oscillospiraceae bacterium]
MAAYIIEGGHKITGEHTIQGSKNAALPILAASAATKRKVILHNCPKLTDIFSAFRILEHLGCKTIYDESTRTANIDATGLTNHIIPEALMRETRASIFFLGPLLAALGKAQLTPPGGCPIGERPIDMHIEAMEALGAKPTLSEDGSSITFEAPEGLIGTRISLRFPSVGVTENAIMAAIAAKGITVITGCAREPEIIDLADFLNAAGAKIYGAGENTIVIEGTSAFHDCEYTVIPDRIAPVTFLAAAAITKGDLLLKGVRPDHLDAVLTVLDQSGCRIQRNSPDSLYLNRQSPLRRFPTIRTAPYPGFPTDAQPFLMALAALGEGITAITENIFENRFRHAHELIKMGADIIVDDKVAFITGVRKLHGAAVESPDLRAGAALVVAGLAAEGITRVEGIHHIRRGNEALDAELNALGAKITQED